MPGWGQHASGSSGAPITFGSYGTGQATLTQGVWFNGDSNLTFEDLTLGSPSGMSGRGLQGTGDNITVQNLTIGHATLGIESVGDNWKIVDNTIFDTGDSGMLLGFNAGRPGDAPGGHSYLVTGNTITDTGMNSAYTYGTHGIYLKVANATVTNNTITNFHDDGISIRYRDNTVTGNHISNGPIGLAWFQYDNLPGTSAWNNNTLTAISNVGIFVCGTREGCRKAQESFSIKNNTIQTTAGQGPKPLIPEFG